MIRANDPSLNSWVDVPADNDFPIQNLPFGIAKLGNKEPGVVSAIGEYIIDLRILAEHAFFDDMSFDTSVFAQPYLNDFIALGKKITNGVRDRLSLILDTDYDEWDASELKDYFLHPMKEAKMMMPVQVGDYTDFYSSREHATNVGTMFRDPNNALLPNWLHLPVGYHGRASSIVVSGTEIKRPKGQTKPKDDEPPVYGPCRLLDFELEMAFIVGKETAMGSSISTDEAEDHIFGMVIFNDWSARDIQKWEYVPLGPFLGKNFASTISPWVVTLEALDPFRIPGYNQKPEVLPYLEYQGHKNYDINLEVSIRPPGKQADVVCRSNYKHMYWNMTQQLAHHSVNGCNFRVGDMCASGTISGKDPSSFGSMLELSWRGTKPLKLSDGSERKFINDGDTVIMKASAEKDGVRIGFGEATGKIIS